MPDIRIAIVMLRGHDSQVENHCFMQTPPNWQQRKEILRAMKVKVHALRFFALHIFDWDLRRRLLDTDCEALGLKLAEEK